MPTVSKGDLQGFVERFLEDIAVRERSGAAVAALSGDLGAGKTTFVQHVARSLGITEPVTSPTFVIEQIYTLKEEQPFDRLVHIDAYRLESGEDLQKLGWDELIIDPKNLVVVEWADRVQSVIPEDAVWLEFKVVDESNRAISQI